jgi:hypothetical protein
MRSSGQTIPESGARRETIRPVTSTEEISHDKVNLKFFLA